MTTSRVERAAAPISRAMPIGSTTRTRRRLHAGQTAADVVTPGGARRAVRAGGRERGRRPGTAAGAARAAPTRQATVPPGRRGRRGPRRQRDPTPGAGSRPGSCRRRPPDRPHLLPSAPGHGRARCGWRRSRRSSGRSGSRRRSRRSRYTPTRRPAAGSAAAPRPLPPGGHRGRGEGRGWSLANRHPAGTRHTVGRGAVPGHPRSLVK